MKINKWVIHNESIGSQENKEINIMKNNFVSTLIHLPHNTQTYKRKMKNIEKFERIGNTEETYPTTISKWTSLVPGKPETFHPSAYGR